ncbi:GNAT family N-acetyltransferase [Flavobacteriales bacterium]|nr:GNAT family N-acetyltransferase [Flavobacteriales bacterium]
MKGNKISLRSMEPVDIELLYQWENTKENWHISGTHAPFSKHILEQFVNSENDIFINKQMRLMIVENVAKRVIGTIDLFEFDPLNRRAGVGILIADSANRSKGFAKDALQVLIDYTFTVINVHQLFCHVQESNEASLRLFKGIGFKITGTKKDWSIQDGQWENQHFLQYIK